MTFAAASIFALASCSGGTKEAAKVVEEEVVEVVEAAMPEVQVVKLEEIDGEFTTTELTLKEGTYSFEVTNNGIDHAVAFVLAPSKEDLKQEDWITDAMLTDAVNAGETSSSKKPVTLSKGEYLYFCPMNPTPQYKLTVQ